MGKSDLPVQLADLISELKTLDVMPDMLLGITTEHAATREKLKDIARLYERFNEKSEGLFDTEDKINLVIDHIPEADFVRRSHLVIHGFDIYNAQTVRFIKALMRTAKDTVMSFYYAPAGAADSGTYEICNENRDKFLADAMKLGLKTEIVTEERMFRRISCILKKNLDAYPAEQSGAHGREASRAPQTWRKRCGRCAQVVWLNQKIWVCLPRYGSGLQSAERYVPAIARVFRQAGVPCFAGGETDA